MHHDEPIRILILEDSPDDAELFKLELRRCKLPFEARRVQTAEEFIRALVEFRPDVILADHSLPSFSGLRALDIARKASPDVPFIFVSGSIGEEQAIESVRAGATDYVLKHRLSRLAPAVERALREARERGRLRRAERALRESEERYALAVQGTHDGIWDWNLNTDELYLSPRWKAMLGLEEDEIGSDPDEWFRRIHPGDLDRVRTEIKAHVDGLTTAFESEHRIRHRAKGYRWVLSRGVAVRGPDGKAYRMAGSQTDINRRKLAEENLFHNAFYDALTGLPNRALFLDRLVHRIGRARRTRGSPYAVLFLDLDRFKLVNDSFGHGLGDTLLREAARRLARSIRPGDTVARLGGDEFAILIEYADEETALRVARRIQRALKAPIDVGARELFTSASIGIALGRTGEEQVEDLLRDADTAMYRAKTLGRDRYVVFDGTMHARAVMMFSTDADLRRALDRGELEVYYQPIVSFRDGRIEGFEALLRWNHPERGLVLPSQFIPIAEETGLIIPIERWVLRQACRQVHEWRTRNPGRDSLYVSVNLSGKEFGRTDLAGCVRSALGEFGLEGGGLTLEVTESVLMSDGISAAESLRAVRTSGVRCYLDDFGTGYSALSYLHRLPIDALKIDRSFIQGLGTRGEGHEIVRTITMLGQNLGKHVIAEGVETSGQLGVLRSLGCGHGQGEYFSEALPKDRASALLDGTPRWAEAAGAGSRS